MRYGVTIFCTDLSIQPAELAEALQERGFDSLWVPEHTHIPTSRRTPYPNGGELPDEYRRGIDPFVGLTPAALAPPPPHLRTGILLLAQRDPHVTPHAGATRAMVTPGPLSLR